MVGAARSSARSAQPLMAEGGPSNLITGSSNPYGERPWATAEAKIAVAYRHTSAMTPSLARGTEANYVAPRGRARLADVVTRTQPKAIARQSDTPARAAGAVFASWHSWRDAPDRSQMGPMSFRYSCQVWRPSAWRGQVLSPSRNALAARPGRGKDTNRRGRFQRMTPCFGHFGQRQNFRASEIVGSARRRSIQKVDEPLCHFPGGNRLKEKPGRERRDRQSLQRPQHHGSQLVKLGRPHDGGRHLRVGDQLLAAQLLAVVAKRNGVDPNDRHVARDVGLWGHELQKGPGLHNVVAAEATGIGRGMNDRINAPHRGRHPHARHEITLGESPDWGCVRAP